MPIQSNMTNDQIINIAIKELKQSEKVYKMYSEFSFMRDIDQNSPAAVKIKHLLANSEPFNKHSESAIKFSELGLKISSDYKDWLHYKKSLKPKIDYTKYISIGLTIISVSWAIFQDLKNNDLKEENTELKSKKDSLIIKNKYLVDSITKLSHSIKNIAEDQTKNNISK